MHFHLTVEVQKVHITYFLYIYLYAEMIFTSFNPHANYLTLQYLCLDEIQLIGNIAVIKRENADL
jgi:hypothetical protein